MARYTGSVCRQCRSEGMKLFLKGERCLGDKCAFSRRAYSPGMHGQKRGSKVTEYGRQLREKQKAKKIYGIFEKQFRIYYRKADKKRGVTGDNLLELLERRLDNVVYRMGLAMTRAQARQLVLHKHIIVNNRRVNIPSFQVRKGDIVSVHESSRDSKDIISAVEFTTGKETIPWINFDPKKLKGAVERIPIREDINIPVTEQLIVELYSK